MSTICPVCKAEFPDSWVQPIRCNHNQPGRKWQERNNLVQRVQERVGATKRLIDWLTFFSIESETGVGDTVQRFLPLAGTELHEALTQLLKQCNCKDIDAVQVLNKKYSYEARNIVFTK